MRKLGKFLFLVLLISLAHMILTVFIFPEKPYKILSPNVTEYEEIYGVFGGLDCHHCKGETIKKSCRSSNDNGPMGQPVERCLIECRGVYNNTCEEKRIKYSVQGKILNYYIDLFSFIDVTSFVRFIKR